MGFGYFCMGNTLANEGQEEKEEDNRRKREAKELLLFEAVNSGDIKLLQELLESGTNPNCNNTQGQTPLHIAVSHGQLDIINVLLQHPETNPNVR